MKVYKIKEWLNVSKKQFKILEYDTCYNLKRVVFVRRLKDNVEFHINHNYVIYKGAEWNIGYFEIGCVYVEIYRYNSDFTHCFYEVVGINELQVGKI